MSIPHDPEGQPPLAWRSVNRRSSGWLIAGVIGALSLLVYWLANRGYDAGRGDFFYLADAFLHGRTWIDVRLGPWDVIPVGDRVYVPFAPFPAILLVPLVAVMGPVQADGWEPLLNAGITAFAMMLAWNLSGRIGVVRRIDRVWLVLLLGLSTQLLWVTTRGGVWHTGHLVATVLTFLTLLEIYGRQRTVVIGLLTGAAFLTRAPLAFAGPAYALWYLRGDELRSSPGSLAARVRRLPIRPWAGLLVGFLPALVFFLGYNLARFGSPAESGYAMALLPDWLDAQRARGLFSPVHVPVNLDYLFVHLPTFTTEPPFLRPDGLGMSIVLTSPGLLLAVRAPWRDPRAGRLLAGAAFVLVPTLLYYGGGWQQYGYRYALDSIPFVWALSAMAAAVRGRIAAPWKLLIVLGVLVNAIGVYWAYRL